MKPTNYEYGVIGYPLSHSFSPRYFTDKFLKEGIDATYSAFPLKDIADLPPLLASHPFLRGINVTLPYKTAIIPFLTSRSSDVASIGASNCVVINGDELVGYNTDWRGFRDSLVPLLQPGHKQALVLGFGGAAKAVVYALRQMNIPFVVASRTAGQGTIAYDAITEQLMQQYQLIINTTPLGMYPDEFAAPPIPYDLLSTGHLLYDLIYNPSETLFLSRGIAAGASIKNGQEMLELQAEYSWNIWQEAHPIV